ncbi:hypothetical protein [Chitinivibrio alkaliphilus]|uniref:1,4-dihydroxy-2-naphthoate octaprenyltransferase n=1 Tax=Chitinivibrio alkaliphilus ACht1 TaxID=1313304 RepID=U7DAE8_9BACT|nr:hypothetical protein [Chitinivibrio alkaliphilus]ERP32107.1 hypothetical protein CALK_0828 [Chitinivibrio alkaliphilus ACht1]
MILRSVADYFFLTRPVVALPALGFALFGYRIAQNDQGAGNSWTGDAVVQLLPFIASVLAVYVINQVQDRHVDEKNGGVPLLLLTGISHKGARFFAFFLHLFLFCCLCIGVIGESFLFFLVSSLGLCVLFSSVLCYGTPRG